MMKQSFEVVGMGHPILDVTMEVEDAFLQEHGLSKGGMHLVDETKSQELLGLMATMQQECTAGGSAANTLACIAALGGKTLLIGKVGADSLGDQYLELAEKDGIWSGCKTHTSSQGMCKVFTTKDKERTFATFLGASQTLETSDVEFSHLLDAKVLHLEGYLLDSAKETVFDVVAALKEKDVLVSIDLADVGVIQRHREDLEVLMKDVDIIFANETEAQTYTGVSPEDSVAVLSELASIVVVKLGSEGSIISKDGETVFIPINEVEVNNSNGAGDAYAGGFLWSLLQGHDIETMGKIAAYCGGEAVKSSGARIENKYLKAEIQDLL